MALACFSVLKSLIHLLFQANIFTVFSSKKTKSPISEHFWARSWSPGSFWAAPQKVLKSNANGLKRPMLRRLQLTRLAHVLGSVRYQVPRVLEALHGARGHGWHVHLRGADHPCGQEQWQPRDKPPDHSVRHQLQVASKFFYNVYEVVFLQKILFSWQIYPCLFLLCFYNLIKSRFVFYPPSPYFSWILINLYFSPMIIYLSLENLIVIVFSFWNRPFQTLKSQKNLSQNYKLINY